MLAPRVCGESGLAQVVGIPEGQAPESGGALCIECGAMGSFVKKTGTHHTDSLVSLL